MSDAVCNASMHSAFEIKTVKYIEFTLQGIKQKIYTNGLTPETTLNDYLRKHLKRTGTKFMCREGGCGSCVVVAHVKNTRNVQAIAVNSCLVSILSCSGWDITTIEALGNRQKGYHRIQDAIVRYDGTQCGFCTPGMVMNMYALMETGKTKMTDIENSFGGHICRCTGYRSILTAFKSLASDRNETNEPDETSFQVIPDIEELKVCENLDCEETCLEPCFTKPRSICYDLNDLLWYKVGTINEIFSIIYSEENINMTYRFVAGNTAKGIYKDMDKSDYYIDIFDVPELCGHSLSRKKLTLGANCTLTETIDIFLDVSQKSNGFKYLLKLVEHLDLVANVPVRNIGTLAGNLCIKHLHKEFPSDIFILLETVNARIITDSGAQTQSSSPHDFLNLDLTKTVIKQIELFPLDDNYHLESYKIMPRAQNAHAYVNTGFLFNLTTNKIVKKATLVFGGINPQFVHATEAEQYIIGKQLMNNNNINMLLKILASEVNPDHIKPDASPEFRRQLAVALTYKYILSLAPDNILSKEIRSGGRKLLRNKLSTGVQEYTTNTTIYPVGQPVHKLEAYDQVSGVAEYVLDIPDEKNQLYAVFITCPYPAGSTLTKIDASKALEIEGVTAFFSAVDIPGVNSFVVPLTRYVAEPLFVPIGEKVKFYDQTIGLIVGTSLKIATEAARLVEIVCDSTDITPLLTIPDVIKNGADERIHHVTTWPSTVSSEKTLKGFQINGTINLGPQYHYPMEMQVVQVIPKDDGGLSIQPSAQDIDGNQYAVSSLLNILAHKIDISIKRVGGAFGSKVTRSHLTTCAAALAAFLLNKPVKMRLTLKENMSLLGKRNPAYGTYNVTTNSDGKILTLNTSIFTNTGAYQNWVLAKPTLDCFVTTYTNSNFEVEYNYVVTDLPANTALRAPGSLEGVAFIEIILEHIAYNLNKDPLDVRFANLNEGKHPTLVKMFKEFVPWSEYKERRIAIDSFNNANRWRKKGLAVVSMSFPLNFIANHGCHVSIYHTDGSVAVSHGGVEMGQGINTKAAQVVAYELGIPIELVSIKPTSSKTVPNNFASFGSLTTESVTRSLRLACIKIKERIEWARNKSYLPANTPWFKLVRNAHGLGQSLCENHMWYPIPPGESNYIIYGIAACEVEVDILTGEHIVQRVDLMEDTGDSSNPFIDIGQVEGAFVMGMGYWTSEQIVFDHEGRILTNNSWNYKPPGAKDIPVDFRVKLPTGQRNTNAPYGNKCTSEPPACLAVSVALAIKDALRTARKVGNSKVDSWIQIDGPFTVESKFMNSCNNLNQYRL